MGGKLRRGPVATQALAPSFHTATISENWNGEDDAIDLARLKLAQGSNLYALTSEADFQMLLKIVEEAGRFLVVDYYAPWCRTCQRFIRQLQNIAKEEHFRDVFFASVDFERARELCKTMDVQKLPTVEIYKGRELKNRWAGSSKKRLVENLSNEMEAAAQQDVERVTKAYEGRQ